MKEKKLKDLTIKNAPEITHKIYAEFKKICEQKGWKLKIQAPRAMEIGMIKIINEVTENEKNK